MNVYWDKFRPCYINNEININHRRETNWSYKKKIFLFTGKIINIIFRPFFKVDFANIFYLCFFFFSFTVSFNYLYKLIYIDLINTKCMRRHVQAEPNKRYFASIKAVDKIQSIQYKCQNVSYNNIRKIFFAFPFCIFFIRFLSRAFIEIVKLFLTLKLPI